MKWSGRKDSKLITLYRCYWIACGCHFLKCDLPWHGRQIFLAFHGLSGYPFKMAQDLQQPETVRFWDPESKQFGQVPVQNAQKALARGLVSAVSAARAVGEGAAQGATLGFADELLGAANAAAEIPQALREGSTERLGKAYHEGRDTAREDVANAQEQHPYAYKAGQVAGSIPTAIAAPGGIAGGAALGAVQGLGETESLSDPGQAAKDVAQGALAGAALPAAFKGVAKTAQTLAPGLKNLAGSALLKSADLTPENLGVSGQKEAVGLAKQALKEPGLVPPVLSRHGATADVLKENSKSTLQNAGKDLGNVYDAFDAQHGPTVPGRDLALAIKASAADAVRSKPELASHVARGVRQIDPEAFDGAAKAMVQSLGKQGAREAVLANPEKLISPAKHYTLAETQAVLNRLRGLGAYPKGAAPSVAELTAKQNVLTPAWNEGAGAIREAAQTHGGTAAREAVEAARGRYNMNVAIQKGANAAQKPQPTGPELAMKVLRPITGAAIGHQAGGLPGLGLGVAGEQLAEKVIAPRVARAIHNVSESTGQVPEALSKFGGTFGRMFADQLPERRVQLDHKLQELSPRYRELRAKAAKAHDQAAAQAPQEEKKPLD